VVWPVKNLQGIVSGIAQSAEPDPLHETWSCGYFFPAATRTGFRCLPFRWQNGLMTALPTLGGTHGFAAGTNNRGDTTGWAENTVADPTCVAPQVLQFRAVLWDVDAHARELPPLAGDSVSAATALNDRGDVVGISGICDIAVGQRSAIHAVRWQNGVPQDLGNIGGDAWNTPTAVNARGDIVGFANVAPGIDFNPHAFLWTAGGGMVDLGALPGDTTSQASGINASGQIVGAIVQCGRRVPRVRVGTRRDARSAAADRVGRRRFHPECERRRRHRAHYGAGVRQCDGDVRGVRGGAGG
jgi:probable HAF family extracellular repeat protein